MMPRMTEQPGEMPEAAATSAQTSAGAEIERLDAEAAADALPALAALLVDAVADGAALGFLAGLGAQEAEAWWSREVLPDLASGRAELLAAFDGDHLLGAALLRPDPRPAAQGVAALTGLVVHTRARRRGVARALLAEVEAGSAAGGRTLLLTEVPSRSAAEAVIGSAGWSRIGRVAERLRHPDGTPVGTALFERRLGPRAQALSVRIRGARLTDAARIGQIHVRAWQTAYQDHMPEEFLADLDPELREAQMLERLTYPRQAERIWVMEHDGGVVGFAVTGTSGDPDAVTGSAELYSLYIDPPATRTGLGRQLLEHALDDMRRRGARSIAAWTFEGALRGRRLLSAAGFRDDGEERTFTAMGEVLREHRMRLVVSPGP